MKGTIKAITGGLKMIGSMMPFAIVAGALGVSSWLIADGVTSYNKTLNEARENPAIHEMIESDKAILDEQRENKQLTEIEYLENYDYWDSNENLVAYLKAHKDEYKDYLDVIKPSDDKSLAGCILLPISLIVGGVGLFLYVALGEFLDIFDKSLEDFRDVKDVVDAKRREKRLEKEIGDYTEEVDE